MSSVEKQFLQLNMEICSLRHIFYMTLLTIAQCEMSIDSEATLKMDEALLTVRNQMSSGLQILYTSDYCYKCLDQPLASMEVGPGSVSVVLSTRFTLTLKASPVNVTNTLCSLSYLFEEAGHYCLWVTPGDALEVKCYITSDKLPHNTYQPLWVAALVLILLALIWASIPFLSRCSCTLKLKNLICCHGSDYSMEKEETRNEVSMEQSQPKSSRLKSLDTFRGFSIMLMVFVNYGGGGYWFFQHAPWNGLTIADLVMPWFVFIIGTSVMLAFSSMRRKGVTRLQLLRKLSWRTVVLMLIGFCFINYSPRDGLLSSSWLRIPGVLQRLAFTYFILSLIQMFSSYQETPPCQQVHWWTPLQDVLLYWPEWIFILLLETVWLCVTFLLPVPNCPTGYLGAGGIGDNGLYPNCTGGAAAYIDKWLLGHNIYWHPTCKAMYHTTQPFDPEGILGTINSIVLGFIGMQAGKIFIFYRKMNNKIIIRFTIWAVILGILAAVLSKCTRDSGFIPVNKNLWSLSYVACMGCMSFVLLGMMYFVVDIKGWWGGQPFIYPGMNSIFVYVGHSMLGFYFPFSWEMRYQDSHWEPLFQSMWGTALWIFISYLLYRKQFFLKI